VGFGKPATLPTHRRPRTTTGGEREGIRAHENRIRGGGNAVNGLDKEYKGWQVGSNFVREGRGLRSDLPVAGNSLARVALLFAPALSPGVTKRAATDFGMPTSRIPENIVGAVAEAGKALDRMYSPSIARKRSRKVGVAL
jgi:hypothetical protein